MHSPKWDSFSTIMCIILFSHKSYNCGARGLTMWWWEERKDCQSWCVILGWEGQLWTRLYTMRDASELCVKTSKISKLCKVYSSWFASMRTWSYACIVMRTISPRSGNFVHHQRKNSHSTFLMLQYCLRSQAKTSLFSFFPRHNTHFWSYRRLLSNN